MRRRAVVLEAIVLRVALPQRLPQAVVFDMDGLLLDTERLDGALWRQALAEVGYVFPDEWHRALIGRREADTQAQLRAALGVHCPLVAVQARVAQLWAEALSQAPAPRKPDAEELVRYLSARGVPIAVATSTHRGKALRCLGTLAEYFDAIVCGDEVVEGKPAPEIYLRAAERLGRAPADCLALEDSPAGWVAATAAGFTGVFVPDLVDTPVAALYWANDLRAVLSWWHGLANPTGLGQDRTAPIHYNDHMNAKDPRL